MQEQLSQRMFTLVGALCSTLLMDAQNPVPNPGFETWVDGDPTGWTTTNTSLSGIPITANSPGHSGSTACRGTYLGMLAQPVINTIDADNQPLPITEAYEHLRFYYLLNLTSATGGEWFTAGAAFTNAAGTNVGQAFAMLDNGANTSTWTYMDLPVSYTGTAPTGVNVNFTLYGISPAVGSYFVVDDVALENGTANSIGELDGATGLGAAYPVPASTVVNLPFAVEHASAVHVHVVDAAGRTLVERDLGVLAPGRYKEVVEVHGWAAGTYTAMLRTASGVFTRVMMVGH